MLFSTSPALTLGATHDGGVFDIGAVGRREISSEAQELRGRQLEQTQLVARGNNVVDVACADVPDDSAIFPKHGHRADALGRNGVQKLRICVSFKGKKEKQKNREKNR